MFPNNILKSLKFAATHNKKITKQRFSLLGIINKCKDKPLQEKDFQITLPTLNREVVVKNSKADELLKAELYNHLSKYYFDNLK